MSTSTPHGGVLTTPDHVPAPPRRRRGAVLAAALCGLLGLGLTGAAGYKAVSDHRAAQRPVDPAEAYRKAASLWHSTPVDTLFPPVLDGQDAGPGGADRTWTRITPAADAACSEALAADWQALFAETGCTRVLRATYTDATRSSLVTVGMVFTPAEAAAMDLLRGKLTAPTGYKIRDNRRAAWTATVLADAPVVVYTVSAFADGRRLGAPSPAEDKMAEDARGRVAQAGLGHEAKAVADLVERTLSTLATSPQGKPGTPSAEPSQNPPASQDPQPSQAPTATPEAGP
ncbi:hypothetical protein OHA37_31430 [Streptomyces sp. NBC_00335]|uniref:hypothetical protein n=1 Tax=unclassified Streptomyces TaxID=2593676 RepID=UPI00224F32EA|nr:MULTISPECIES: hypothetical protein [unclassified Streptomyces]MCX5408364.1 hypothetical protein [Streptomyces sp. NBC_00086]